MDFEAAKTQFADLSQTIATDNDRFQFFNWLSSTVIPEVQNQTAGLFQNSNMGGTANRIRRNSEGVLPATVKLEMIAEDIRSRVPVEAVMPTENIIHPTIGEDSNLNPVNSVHLDAFLYDEEAEEGLISEGLLSRAFCRDCGSRRTEELTFVTHSCSKERLEYIFCGLLPSLEGKTLIDIGSRIGAVLYGAYYYSKAAKIVGIEMNKELCKLQNEIIGLHKLEDRVSIVESDMCEVGGLLRTGDVVILNNVFDWFMPPHVQVQMWQFLRSTLSKGSLLVTIPSLESSLSHLNTGIELNNWVIPLNMFDPSFMEGSQVETSEVCLYQIINGS